MIQDLRTNLDGKIVQRNIGYQYCISNCGGPVIAFKIFKVINYIQFQCTYIIKKNWLKNINCLLHVPVLDDSGFFKNFLYQGDVKSSVFWVFEDLKFKISEGYDQNWCFPDSAQLGKHQLRSSTTPETVAFTPP